MAEKKPNAAFFILTQNTDVRKTYLKTCLYFLFKHFNAKYRYPVVIFHEGDFDARAQEEILLGVRTSCRALVSFYAVDAGDFDVPSHIDKEKMRRCIEACPVPYWRNVGYRNMCRWWVVNVHKYASGFDYYCRLDDDSIIEEPLTYDIFEWAAKKELVYASVMLHLDCSICCHGMKEFFEARFPDDKAKLREMFVPQKIPVRAYEFHRFRSLLSIMHQDKLPELGNEMELWAPINLYNNFHITKTSFWRREDVQSTIKAIDEDGSIYYYRWGDAPLHTLLVGMYAKPEEVTRCVFAYSKRMQRESFPGDDGKLHSYMPSGYDKSSCITETRDYPVATTKTT